ncbi:charged multivesicular body protein 6 [Sarotherodon galilaeus]
MDNQEHDITDPFLAINLALAMLNQNTDHSQNTHSQSSEHPAAINDNDPFELLNLALAPLAPSESLSQNSCQSLGVESDEIQTQSNVAHSPRSLTQNISSSEPEDEVQIPPELLSQIDRLNESRFIDSHNQQPLGFSRNNVQSPANEPLHHSPVNHDRGPSFQQGGNPEPSCFVRNKFNNVEIRHILNFPPPDDIPDYAQYYQGIMGSARERSNRVFSHTRPGDVVQLELIGHQLQNDASDILRDNHNLSEFENLFLRAVQSNWSVMCDSLLELVAQIVRHPSGSGKRILRQVLNNKIVKKKRRFLYVVHNPDNSLCFAISLAHLLHPDFNGLQAETLAKEIPQKAGLNDQTPVGFNQIITFERLLSCKIIVFYCNEYNRNLCKFQTTTPTSEKTLFFMGTNYICNYCYTGYNHILSHFCPGHCSVCMQSACSRDILSPILCADCNCTCRSPLCFQNHKKVVERHERVASNCQLYKKMC